jgi:hypothetical protein
LRSKVDVAGCRRHVPLSSKKQTSTNSRSNSAFPTGHDRRRQSGWKLSGAINTAERKLADKTLVHGGQRLMAWAVSNARVEPRGNAIVITKQASVSPRLIHSWPPSTLLPGCRQTRRHRNQASS